VTCGRRAGDRHIDHLARFSAPSVAACDEHVLRRPPIKRDHVRPTGSIPFEAADHGIGLRPRLGPQGRRRPPRQRIPVPADSLEVARRHQGVQSPLEGGTVETRHTQQAHQFIRARGVTHTLGEALKKVLVSHR
jgi:hypothetical protein